MSKLYLVCFLSLAINASAQWQPTNSAASDNGSIYHMGGNVGIGNMSPSYELDINGSLPYIRLHSSIYSNNPSVLTKKQALFSTMRASIKLRL